MLKLVYTITKYNGCIFMIDIGTKIDKIIDTFVQKARKAPTKCYDIRCEIHKAIDLHVRTLTATKLILNILARDLWQSGEQIEAKV